MINARIQVSISISANTSNYPSKLSTRLIMDIIKSSWTMDNITTEDNDTVSDALPTAFSLPYTGTTFLWLTIVYAVLTGFGLVVNFMVIFIVCRYDDMHTPTNYFFCNLALTDFLFLPLFGVPNVLRSMEVIFNNIGGFAVM